MLIKSLCLGAVLVSTPLCLFTPDTGFDLQGKERVRAAPPMKLQDPRDTKTKVSKPAPREANERAEIQRLRRELEGAKRDVEDMRRQLGELLDTMDQGFVAQQHRNCSPSRNRALMSHYQWLDKNHHDERASKALATIVEQAGNDAGHLNGLAWGLMTDKETAGQFDRVALALAERMEQGRGRLPHRYIDTVALARFLNGQVDQAVALQKRAIAAGGNSDDYRRRLRTYEAAQAAVAKAATPRPERTPLDVTPVNATNGTIVATVNEDEDE
ncbi:MAG: hypothetical protein KDE27_22870 [Planctomycetes bacterium]|nr:hypothetical protein [Planctomycetota bacterium]